MTTVNPQVQYESGRRIRYGALAFGAAVLLVLSQLLQLSGLHAPVNELTVALIVANKREAQDIAGAALDTLGLFSAGVLLFWLHKIARVRRPGTQKIVAWLCIVGGFLAGTMAIIYTVVVAQRAHTFVTTGNQGYPRANQLTTGGLLIVLPLLEQIGMLMITIGCIWTSLTVMRVGLFPRIVGYAGVVAGALFMFPIGAVVPVVQGFFFAAAAVLLVGRWPQGEPPAWTSGEAVPWMPNERQVAAQQAAADRRAQRAQRGQRRKVSDSDVLAAVDRKDADEAAVSTDPSPSASATKRKRKRRG